MIDGPNGVLMGVRQQSPHESKPAEASSPAPTPAPSAQEVGAAYQVVTKYLTGKTLDAHNLAAAAAQARRYAMLHEQAIAEAELQVIAQYEAQHAKADADRSGSAMVRAARRLGASAAFDDGTLAAAQHALESGQLHVAPNETIASFSAAMCSKTEPDPPPIVLKDPGKAPSLSEATDRLNAYMGSGMSLQEAVGMLRVENGATAATEDVLARAALAAQAPSYVSAYAKTQSGPGPVELASAHLAKLGVFGAATLDHATKAMTIAVPKATLDAAAARKAADKVSHDKPGTAQFTSDMRTYRSALSAEIAQATGKHGTAWLNDPANIDAWLKSEVAVANADLEPFAQAAAGTSEHSPEHETLADRAHLLNVALEETRVLADIENADAQPGASRTQIDLARSQRLTTDFSALGLVHFDSKTQQWVHNASSAANPDASTMLTDLLGDTSVQALKQNDIEDALRHTGGAQAESSDRAKADLRATSNALAPFKQGGTTLFYGDMVDAVEGSQAMRQRFDDIASSIKTDDNVKYVHDVAQTLQDVAMPADADLTRALYQQKFRGRFEDFVAHGSWRAPSGLPALWQSLDAPKYYIDTSNVYASLGDGAQAASQTEQGASLMNIVKTRMDGSHFVGQTYEGSLKKGGPDEKIKSFYLNWKDKHGVWAGNAQLFQDIAQQQPRSDTARFIEAELPIAVDSHSSSTESAPAYVPPDATQTPSGTQVITSRTQLINALGDAYQAKALGHAGKDGARYSGSEKVYGNTTLDDLAQSALASQHASAPSADMPLELTMLPLMYWRQDQDPNKDSPEALKLLEVDGVNGRRYVGPANTQSFASYSDWTRASGFAAGMMLSTQHVLQTEDGQSQLWDQTVTGQKKLSNGEILLQAGEGMAGMGAMAVVSFVSPEAEGIMMPLLYDGAQMYFAATGVKAAIDAADRIAHDPSSASAWAEGGWEVAANSFTALSIASHFGMGRLPDLLTRAFEAGQAANGETNALSLPTRLLVSAADNQVGAKTYMALAGAPDAVLTSQRVLLKGAAVTNGVLFGAQGVQMGVAWAQGKQVSPAAVMQLVATIGMGQFGRLYHVEYSARPSAIDARENASTADGAPRDGDARPNAQSGGSAMPRGTAHAALAALQKGSLTSMEAADGGRAVTLAFDSGAAFQARLLGARGSEPPTDVADVLLPGKKAAGQRFELMHDVAAGEFVIVPRIRGGATDKDPEREAAVPDGDAQSSQTARRVGLPKRRLSREEEDFAAELETTAVTDDVIEVAHESDPSVFVHIALEGATGALGEGPLDAATVRVMSLYRGMLPKGSGHRLLMRALERFGVRPTERLIFEYVEHHETVQARADGVPADETPLARTGMRAMRALGLTPSSAHYADNRWNHWDLVIELDPHASAVAPAAAAESPLVWSRAWNGDVSAAVAGQPTSFIVVSPWASMRDDASAGAPMVLSSGWDLTPSRGGAVLAQFIEATGQRNAPTLTISGAAGARTTAEAIARGVQVQDTVLGRTLEDACARLQRTPTAWRFTAGVMSRVTVELAPAHHSASPPESQPAAAELSLNSLAAHMPDLIVSSPATGSPLTAFGRAPSSNGDFTVAAAVRDGRIVDGFGAPLPIESLAHQIISTDRFAKKARVVLLTDGHAPNAAPELARLLRHLQVPVLARDGAEATGQDGAWRLHLGDEAVAAADASERPRPDAILGYGNSKVAYAVRMPDGARKVATVLRDSRPSSTLDDEYGVLQELKAEGLPVLDTERGSYVGRPALYADRYATSLKSLLKTTEGQPRDALTERATLALLRDAGVPITPETADAISRVGRSMAERNIGILDFDLFLGRVGEDGRVDGSAVVADPLQWRRTAPLASDLEDLHWLSQVVRSGARASNEPAPRPPALSGHPLREVALSDDRRSVTLTDTKGRSVTAALLGGREAPPAHPDDILMPNGEKRGQRFELVRDPQDGTFVLLPRVRGGAVDEDPETSGGPASVNAMRALQDGTIAQERYAELLTDLRAALHRRNGMSPARSESIDALRIRIERLLEDEARTPVPRDATGKRRTVEGNGAEHDARVRAIVNTALLAARASVTNGELLRTPLIQTHAQALDLVIGIRTLSVRNSESLALRDADHYLSNLTQEWQVPFDRQATGQYRTPSAPLARLSGLVSRVYDLTKARQPRTGSSADMHADADISNVEPRDIAPSPPGGRAWAALGTRHFLRMRKTAGSPDHHWVLTETPGGRRASAAAIRSAESRTDDGNAGGPRAGRAAGALSNPAARDAEAVPAPGPGGIYRLTRPKAKPGERDRLLYSGLPVQEDPAAMLYVPRATAKKTDGAGDAGMPQARRRADDSANRRTVRDPIAQSPEQTGPFQTGYPAKKSEYPLPQWMATYVPETGLIRTEARKGDVQWVPRRYTGRRDATNVVTIAPDIHVISAFGTREAVFGLDGEPITAVTDLRRRLVTPQRLANRLSENLGLDERAYTPGQPIALLAEHTAAGGRASYAQQLANEVHAPVFGLLGSYEDRRWMLHFPDAPSHPVWQPDMSGRRWSPDGGQPVRVKWNLLERRDSSDLDVHSDGNPIKIDSYLAPQGMFVVNGHTSELLAQGPARVASSARAAGHTSNRPVLVLTTDEDAQRHAFARQLADELQSPVLILTDKAWALDGGAVVKNTVTVSRVEGAQNRRMTIDDEGKVTFLDTSENRAAAVWLNFGPLERTQSYFEQKHGTMDDVVVHSFEVPRSVLDEIRRNAVRQRAAQEPGNENKPLLGDWLASPDQFGLRWPDAIWLQGQAIRGTGKTTVFEPRLGGPDGAGSRRRTHRPKSGEPNLPATVRAVSDGNAAVAPQIHPRKDEAGQDVVIASPTTPSDSSTWANRTATAVFVPDGEHPDELNGIAMTPWEAPTTLEEWQNVAGQNPNLDEFADRRVKKAGTVVVEPDGRVWIIESTNHFTGARTFPKGTVDDGLSLQATAIKETYEETGLRVEIVAHLTDFRQNTGKPKTRYYLARRTGGTPTAMGWETQGVYLIPGNELGNTLKTARDLHVLRALRRNRST